MCRERPSPGAMSICPLFGGENLLLCTWDLCIRLQCVNEQVFRLFLCFWGKGKEFHYTGEFMLRWPGLFFLISSLTLLLRMLWKLESNSAMTICPVLDPFFSQLFQVRWGEPASILWDSVMFPLFHHQIQISFARWNLFILLAIAWGACTSCDTEGVRLRGAQPRETPGDVMSRV